MKIPAPKRDQGVVWMPLADAARWSGYADSGLDQSRTPVLRRVRRRNHPESGELELAYKDLKDALDKLGVTPQGEVRLEPQPGGEVRALYP